MKKILTIVLALGALLACNKKEQEPKPVDPKTEQPTPTPPAPAPNPVLHYIASIEEIDEMLQSSERISYEYDDEMRPIGFERTVSYGSKNLVYTGKFDYKPDHISMVYDEHKHQEELNKPTECHLYLDPQTKRVTKFEEKLFFQKDNAVDVREEKDFKYDALGRQIGFTSSFITQFAATWTEGNLSKEVYERDDLTATRLKEYTDIKNNIYPDLNLLLHRMFLSSYHKYLWVDEFGLRTPYLVKKATTSYTQRIPQSDNVLNYTYKLDDLGRPIQIERVDEYERTISYTITYVTK